ncbi:MAG TPA: FIST N-terminal domain-containing protein [Labilithrix sp.]|nr:FIST N-terminal domain-containing protein [Labilithrix sp.]
MWRLFDPRQASLVLVFATAGYGQTELVRAVAAVGGGTPLAGCSVEGVITQEGSNESRFCVAVMAIASDRMRFRTMHARFFAADPFACGRALATSVRASRVTEGLASKC